MILKDLSFLLLLIGSSSNGVSLMSRSDGGGVSHVELCRRITCLQGSFALHLLNAGIVFVRTASPLL